MKKECPIYQTAKFVGKRWTILILAELNRGRERLKRYSYLKKNMPGITPKMLSARLKELEKEGMINKRVDTSSFPIKSEYGLTKKGEGFVEVLKAMKEWAMEYRVGNEHCKKVDCRECDF